MGWIGMTAAAALVAASAPGTAAPKKMPDPNREICKSRPVVGSRVARMRECHSAAQWEDMKLAEQIGLGRQQYNGAQGQAAGELNMIGRLEASQQPQ
jgi:hypothetical protein